MRLFVGLHQPSDAKHFNAAFISVNRLSGPKGRKAPMHVGDWIMDSGAFTEIHNHGRYRNSVSDYATHIRRWRSCGNLLAAVAQDWMCEAFILAKTGLTVLDHQRLTIERYDALLAEQTGVYILPVLQGYEPWEYAHHLLQYGDRLAHGAWVGVGSICKRNSKPLEVRAVLGLIKAFRPDLRLHGFGLKATALADPQIVSMLHTADSMAWSYAARKQGRKSNDWQEAKRFEQRITALLPQ